MPGRIAPIKLVAQCGPISYLLSSRMPFGTEQIRSRSKTVLVISTTHNYLMQLNSTAIISFMQWGNPPNEMSSYIEIKEIKELHNVLTCRLVSVAPLVKTHWGRVTHICVGKLTITGSDNGLSPGRRQAIIWTNAGILLIGSLGTNFNEILIGIQTFSFKKMHLKMSSVKWRPFCLGLNVLKRLVGHDPSFIT